MTGEVAIQLGDRPHTVGDGSEPGIATKKPLPMSPATACVTGATVTTRATGTTISAPDQTPANSLSSTCQANQEGGEKVM
jgi:hypothetical protein